MSALLCSALTEGLRPPRAALDAGANQQAWISLHENSLSLSVPPIQPPRPRGSTPLTADPTDYNAEAVRSVVQALSMDLKDIVALKTLARLHLTAGLWEAAEEACRIILKRQPDDAEALQLLEEAKVQEARLMENLIDDTTLRYARPPAPVLAAR